MFEFSSKISIVSIAAAAAAAVTLLAGRRGRWRSALPPAAQGVEDFTSTQPLGPFQTLGDVVRRFQVWVKVLIEYPRLLAVYEEHKQNGWFEYGQPPGTFADLAAHSATQALLALRQHKGFRSTLEFEAEVQW